MAAAGAVGADVPVCLASKAQIMRGIGEQLSPVNLPALPAVLVNPGVAVATRDVFAKLVIRPSDAPALTEAPQGFAETVAFLKQHGNDLTDAATACAPVIAEVLAVLRATAGCRLARMSGSGATCFALFASVDEAAAAAQMLQAGHGEWWVTPVVLS
jgi:4-diphosphocytidyl-2-C-methyl-D-erythritol kinase